MQSVTSEAALNVSHQNAQPKAARSAADPSHGNDIFASLVDNNAAADAGNRAVRQPAPQNRSDDDLAADNRRPRSASPARNNQNQNQPVDDNSGNPNTAAGPASNASAGGKANAPQHPRAKSTADDGAATSTTSSPSDTPSATSASTTAAPQDGISPIVPSPIAATIPVAVTVTTPTATTASASGTGTAPLAIAAAAIAAVSLTATSALAGVDPDATVPTAAPASADIASATTPTATATVQSTAVATPATDTTPKATPTGATVTAATTTVAAPAPVAPKNTTVKASTSTPTQAQATAASDVSDDANPTATAPLPAALAGKTDATDVTADAAKAAGAAGPASPAVAATPSTHDHAPDAATAHASIDSADTGVQTMGAISPQLSAPAATAGPAGSLNVSAATHAAVPLSGLALEIAASARKGKSSFEIRLDPADLGRIDVRINVDRNGQMTSHLMVEKPETLSMLQQDAPQLQRALHDAGFKTGDGGLQFSLRDQSSSGQNSGDQPGRNTQRLVITNEESVPAIGAGRTYGRMLGSSSGVDIRV